MTRKHEIDTVRAEIATVKELLTEAEGVEDWIGQKQFKGRLDELEQKLAEIAGAERKNASVELLFDGDPVLGSRGIEAEFAGRMIERFQQLVGKLFAQQELGGLGSRGKIPYSKHTQLMVSGFAYGSVGFVLDEMSDQADMYETELRQMVSVATDLISGSAAVEEAEFDSCIEQVDSRALSALRDIFVEMDSKGAQIRIREDERERFLDKEAVHRARLRIEATQIDETSVEMTGILRGFLEEHRKFELFVDREMLYGSATKEAASQFKLMVAQGRPTIGAACRVRMQIRNVTSVNRPTRKVYRLLEFLGIGGEAVPLSVSQGGDPAGVLKGTDSGI